jgi:hypothetical protein
MHEQNKVASATFETFTAVKIWVVVFWVMTPCSPVGGYQRFDGTYVVHFQGRSVPLQKRSFFFSP